MHTMSCISQKWDKPTERFIMGGHALTEGPHNFPSGEPTCLWEYGRCQDSLVAGGSVWPGRSHILIQCGHGALWCSHASLSNTPQNLKSGARDLA